MQKREKVVLQKERKEHDKGSPSTPDVLRRVVEAVDHQKHAHGLAGARLRDDVAPAAHDVGRLPLADPLPVGFEEGIGNERAVVKTYAYLISPLAKPSSIIKLVFNLLKN